MYGCDRVCESPGTGEFIADTGGCAGTARTGPGPGRFGAKEDDEPTQVGGGAGQDGRPSHDTESPTLAFIPTPDPADQRPAGASTELARIVSAHTEELEPVARPGGAAAGRHRRRQPGRHRRRRRAAAGRERTGRQQRHRRARRPASPARYWLRSTPTVRPRTVSGLLERDALCERLRGCCSRAARSGWSVPPDPGRSRHPRRRRRSLLPGWRPPGWSGSAATAAPRRTCSRTSSRPPTTPPATAPAGPCCPDLLRDLCAIVVIDDVEFGGEALEELLAAAPESSFLISSAGAAGTALGAGLGRRAGWRTARLAGLSRQCLARPARPPGRTARWTRPSGPGRSTSGSSPRACRCASSRPRHCCGSARPRSRRWRSPPRRTGRALPQLASGRSRPSSGSTAAPTAAPGRGRRTRRCADPVPLPSVAESAAPALRIARGLSDGGPAHPAARRRRSAASARPHLTCPR